MILTVLLPSELAAVAVVRVSLNPQLQQQQHTKNKELLRVREVTWCTSGFVFCVFCDDWILGWSSYGKLCRLFTWQLSSELSSVISFGCAAPHKRIIVSMIERL